MNNRIGFVLVAALLNSSHALAADAPNLSQCAEAFEQAQALSKQGKPTPALEQLLICAQPSCPAFLTKECTANYDRIKSSLPTVTLIARRTESEPLVDVKVSADGNVLQTRIDGLAVALDPGLHEFVFEHEGDPPVTVRALLAEGERNKPIIAVFPSIPAPEPPPREQRASGPATETQKPPADDSTFRVPAATYALGALGVIGVGLGVTFRVLGASDYNSLADSCGRRCSTRDVDQAKQKYLISNIALGVGAAALVSGGLFLYFGQQHEAHAATNSAGLAVGAGFVHASTPSAFVSGRF